MTITTKIVYEDFQTVEFSLTSTESIQYNKYDIRVRHADTVLDGSGGSVRIAIATVTKSKSFTLSSLPTLFPIPTNSTMTSGELYTATIRVHDASGVWVSLPTCEFYYDTRTFTVDPVDVSSLVIDASYNFVTTAPVVRWDDGVVANPEVLLSTDPLFNYFSFDTVTMSCADVSTEPDHVSTHYDLGEILYGEEYAWNVNGLPVQTAYELWGAIIHALTDPSGNGWTFDASANDYKYIVPEIAPSFDITTSDTYGYYLENPTVTLTLGDVSGTISTNAIKIVIDNISSYEVYPFQSITFELNDVSDNSTLFSKTFDTSGNEYIVYATDTAFITAVDNGLVNGEAYNCNITLNFTDTDVYSPPQSRSTEVQDTFEDILEPISVAQVVNSWQLNSDEGNGLVVTFMKTNQFLGNDSALGENQFAANLDAYGDTYVLAEYSVYNDNWSSWQTLDGGSIFQGAITYATNESVNDGRYLIPKHTSSAVLGSAQSPVYIYTEIPDQDQYKLVKVRLTLQTDNTSFLESKRISDPMYVDPVSAATYPDEDASFRYFPAPAAHDYTIDVPFITSISVLDVVNFSVPASIPPYFKSVITTTGSGADFGSAAETNYSGDNVVIYDTAVTGLSYPVSYTGATFQISVKYVYLENSTIETASNSHTIQQQGLLPVTVASVVNSWQVDPAQGAGLVVTFMKTAQFMGTSSTGYNLDLSSNQATVLAEYNVLDASGNLTAWMPLDGGSIWQGAVLYATDAQNADGVYAVPQDTSSAALGSAQSPVYIYAEIPDQAQCPLVQVRLTLQTDSSAYDPLIAQLDPKEAPIQLSEPMYVDPVSTATYPVADASFRYFLKPAAHDFTNDKPIIDSIDGSGNVLFLVPVSVPPFFSSQVTTSVGGASGTASVVSNDTPDASFNYLSDDVSGLSYLPEVNSSLDLTVSYVSDENTVIYTVPTSMTVQKQGFPSGSFNISACSWNNVNQQIDYTLLINATATTVDRMDGWNLYTKLSTDTDFDSYGNLLITNEALTQNVDLSGNYPDYSTIDVKFVATRSLYLASDNYESQVETVDGLLDVVDFKSTQIINLPDTALPPPVAADITLTNIIYNSLTLTTQYATLSVTLPANAIGTRITEPDTTQHSSSNTVYNFSGIILLATPTAITYTVEFEYDSMVDGGNVSVYSAATNVSFTSGVSNRGAPVIVSKDRVSSAVFNVAYTSSNTGSYSNSVLTSDVYVDVDGSNNDVGTDDGSVNLSSYEGSEVDIYVKDSFSSTYTVAGSEYQTVQVINSAPVTLILAANPAINETSITITSSYLQFSVNNNGTPFIDRVLVVVAQDATTDENDLGTYSLAMFENTAGFTVADSPYANTLSGPAHTLSVIGIYGTTGMEMTTLFQFIPASTFSSAPANVVIHVSNAVEGSDSCAIAELVQI